MFVLWALTCVTDQFFKCHCPMGIRLSSSAGNPTNPICTDSMPILRRMNLPSMTVPTRALMISPSRENVAIGFDALPNVPMY